MSYNRVMVHAPTPPRSFRMPSIKDAVRTDLSGYIPVPPCGNDTDILQGEQMRINEVLLQEQLRSVLNG